MSLRPLLSLIIVILVGFTSCIKDEPLDREADIVDIKITGDGFIDRSISEDNRIELILADTVDLTKVKPIFSLSSNATISPASGEPIDLSFGKEVTYTVTSQSGNYTKDYIVKIGSIQIKWSFDEWALAGTEKYPYPILTDATWNNANSGVVTAIMGGIPIDRYPTDKTTDCIKGEYGASLQTKKGGKVLGFVNIPIFAGNLFRGDFKVKSISNPLTALELGRNHPKEIGKPVTFKGYYKYSPGPQMTDKKGNPIPGTDEMSVYAAIFRVTKGAPADKEYLDGSTILTSERVVARAEWVPGGEGIIEKPAINGFTEFSIPFKYTNSLNYDQYDYRLTLVCSSSKDGNLYVGAVGSELIVDEFEIVCEPIN